MTDDTHVRDLLAARIGGSGYGRDTKIYKFERIKRAKRDAIAARPDVRLLDFGIGENDEPADPVVREAMKREIDDAANRGYADNGIPEFKEAAARFMQEVFGVAVDPAAQVLHTIGSKSALAMLPSVFIDPGDVTIMTVPGYPVAGTHTRYLGGEVHALPLLPENGFLPDLDRIPADVRARAKLMVLNYPNSPTGRVAPPSFWKEAVAFACEERIALVNDAAHVLLSYEARESFLATPGAMDVGVEVHSMSKGFHMIGWRLGFVTGNPLIVRALGDVKDNCDSGQFKAIQKSACAALAHHEIHERARAKYRRRLEKLVRALAALGFAAAVPEGTYFLYVRAPRGAGGRVFATAEAAAEHLLRAHLVLTVPWDDAGAFLRFSVTYEAEREEDEDALMAALAARLSGAALVF
ncbi:MAG TPA: aspartate aminotransferase [Planctomycetes bacterium]|nr:aspartate aminotransferase [Planctomycetota bacterium]